MGSQSLLRIIKSLLLGVVCANQCQVNTQSVFISPCESQLTNRIRIFSVSFRTILVPPKIQTLVVVLSNSSIKVDATLSASGILHCGAFSDLICRYAAELQLGDRYTERIYYNHCGVDTIKFLLSVLLHIWCRPDIFDGTKIWSQICKVVNMAFCKSITIGRVSNVITSGVDTAKFFSVQVDGLPSYSSNTVLSLNTTATAIYPSKVTLTGYNSSVYYAALRSLPAGVYTYAAIVVDPSSLEYAISYTAEFRFQVIKSGQSLLAPSIHSVVFYSDGSYLIISFDCHTNRGNTLATLNCNTLF